MEIVINKKKRITFESMGLICLSILFFYEMFLIYKNVFVLSDSDISSNIIYGKLLLENKSLILNNWYYSTFVDILNIDKIFELLFIFSNNWVLIHFFEVVFVDILLVMSFFYVCNKLEIKNKTWLAFIFVGALSFDSYRYLVYFNIYSVYLIFSFLSIGLMIDVVNATNKKTKLYRALMLFIVVALACTSGLRNVVTLYCPIVGSVLLLHICYSYKKIYYDKIKKYDFVAGIIFAASVLGYLVNTQIIVPYSNYTTYSIGLTSEPMKDFFNVFKKILVNGWIKMFGVSGLDIMSFFCLAILIFTVYSSFKLLFCRNSSYEDRLIVLVFVLSACVTCMTFFISIQKFAPRYLLQSFSICTLIIGMYLKDSKKLLAKFVCIYVALCCSILGIKYLKQDIAQSTNNEIKAISEILKENEINEGYASFWNASLLTEASNGEIEVWHYSLETDLGDLKNDVTLNKMNTREIANKYLHHWLQKYDHFEKVPTNNFFVIVNNKYLSLFSNNIKEYEKYFADERSLYIFNNIEDLIACLK